MKPLRPELLLPPEPIPALLPVSGIPPGAATSHLRRLRAASMSDWRRLERAAGFKLC